MQAKTVIPEMCPYNWAMPAGRPANSDERTPFGQRLHDARLQAGLSQKQVAEELGITQPSYADWERRSVAIKPEYLPQLAELLEVSTDYLIGVSPTNGRRGGPTGKLRRLFEEVGGLSRHQQQRIASVIEDMVTAHRTKSS